ncbi:MAG: class I SAM-dependent methyltransferase [Oscillochloris sp.]|nr:class I SAM-dependent methyltransferase [Oscillochloris sp.]
MPSTTTFPPQSIPTQQGGQRDGGQVGAKILAGLLLCLLLGEGIQDLADTQARRNSQPIVVELGWGGRPDNLIALATRFPNAKIYGIDNAIGVPSPSGRNALGLGPNIEIIKDSYLTYTGPLLKNADVVVSIAPKPGTQIEVGVERFIKPGGTVELLIGRDTLSDRLLGDDLAQRYKSKPLFVDTVQRPLQVASPVFPGSTVGSQLGIPFTSMHFGSGAREIYIGSWN